MITEGRYVLAVPDLKVSADYYRDILGFDIHEMGDPGWRFFVRDKMIIMAGECPDDIHPSELGSHSYFAYLIVDDIDGLYREFQDKGVDFIKEIKSEPWHMREFGIRTVDGHRMMFGCENVATG